MTITATEHPEIETGLGSEPLLTVEDVADYLRLNPETVRVMARRGELPSMKVGKRVWRFKASEIKAWLEAQHEVAQNPSA